MERLYGLFSCMERAEWLLLMNIKCKLLAMAGGFTSAIAQALFPEVLFPNFCTSTLQCVINFRVADDSARAATRKHPQARGPNLPFVIRGNQVVGIVPPSIM
jgi:hypothetical protein